MSNETQTISQYGCFVMFSGPVTRGTVMKVINARKRAERLEAKQPRGQHNVPGQTETVAVVVEVKQG